jgi:ribosomal protein L11 methyltransferase
MYLWRKSAAPRCLHANESLQANTNLVVIERPGRKQLQLEIICESAREVRALVREFGGRAEKLPRDWLKRFTREKKNKPIKIGKRLEILRARDRREANRFPYSLVIPAGLAFGTGDHATTAMSLRLLEEVSRKMTPGWSLVDLGTGSGILSLAAKSFGARRVLAIDNDPRAIATAKENARINKIDGINFRIADARRLKLPNKSLLRRSVYGGRVEIITANLFSELLIEILPKLDVAHWLILSGVLRNQERDLRRALRSQKIDIVEVRRRGKWVAILARGRGVHRTARGRLGSIAPT